MTNRYRTYFNYPDDLLQGGINGALSAGCFVGALLAGFPADKFSRKFTLIGASALFVIGSVFQAASNGVPLLCVGRVLNGKLDTKRLKRSCRKIHVTIAFRSFRRRHVYGRTFVPVRNCSQRNSWSHRCCPAMEYYLGYYDLVRTLIGKHMTHKVGHWPTPAMPRFWIQYGSQFIEGSSYTAAFRIPWAVQSVPGI